MKVLVTGATGYVGVNLLARFPDEHTPIALVRETSRTELLPDGIATRRGDITDPETLTEPMEEADAVVHMAAVNPGSRNSPAIASTVTDSVYRSVNVEGTGNVLDAAADTGVESVVYLSTTKTHPDVEAADPSMYVKTKREAAEILETGSYPFEYTIVAPTYVMGQRDYRLKRYEPFRLAASNTVLVPPLFTPGRINVVHVDTLADSILRYLDEPTNGHELVSGPNVSRTAFAKELLEPLDRRTIVFNVPFRRFVIPKAVGLIDATGITDVDPSELVLNEETGIVPSVHEEEAPVEQKSWRSAVRDTYDWYRRVGLL